jgi:hypothetical protein
MAGGVLVLYDSRVFLIYLAFFLFFVSHTGDKTQCKWGCTDRARRNNERSDVLILGPIASLDKEPGRVRVWHGKKSSRVPSGL